MVHKTRKFYRSGGIDPTPYSPPLSLESPRPATHRHALSTRSRRRRTRSAGGSSRSVRSRTWSRSNVPSLSSADIMLA